MPTTSTVIDAIGLGEAIVTYDETAGQLNDLNTATQLAAITASLANVANPTNPSSALPALITSGAAFSTGMAVLIDDIANDKSEVIIASDFATVIGSALMHASAAASVVPGGKAVAGILTALGNGVSLFGLGIKNYDAVAQGAPIALQELKTQALELLDSAANALAYELVDAAEDVAAAWEDVKADLLDLIDTVSNVVENMGETTFDAAIDAALGALDTIKETLGDLCGSIGITGQSVNVTALDGSNMTKWM